MNFKITESVNAPVDRVFQIFSDFPAASNYVEGVTRIEMVTEGSVGVGTVFRETRIMFGKETTEEMEVTQFSPNDSYCVETNSCGAHFQTDFRFTPQSDSTLVEMEMSSRPITLFAKLTSPISFLMAGIMKRCMLDDIQQLKKRCEEAENDPK